MLDLNFAQEYQYQYRDHDIESTYEEGTYSSTLWSHPSALLPQVLLCPFGDQCLDGQIL